MPRFVLEHGYVVHFYRAFILAVRKDRLKPVKNPFMSVWMATQGSGRYLLAYTDQNLKCS